MAVCSVIHNCICLEIDIEAVFTFQIIPRGSAASMEFKKTDRISLPWAGTTKKNSHSTIHRKVLILRDYTFLTQKESVVWHKLRALFKIGSVQ